MTGKLYVPTVTFERLVKTSTTLKMGPFSNIEQRHFEKQGALFVVEDPNLPEGIAELRSDRGITRFDFSSSLPSTGIPGEMIVDGEP